jgi:hypothetical protein
MQIPPPSLVGSSSVPMNRVRYRDSAESTGPLKPEMQTAQMTTRTKANRKTPTLRKLRVYHRMPARRKAGGGAPRLSLISDR